MVTVAPGTAAPEESETLPRMVPRKVWAGVGTPARNVSEKATSASVRRLRKKLFISYSLIDSVVISNPRDCCRRSPRRTVLGHLDIVGKNILRAGKRSKVFKRKCFYLRYKANWGGRAPSHDLGHGTLCEATAPSNPERS